MATRERTNEAAAALLAGDDADAVAGVGVRNKAASYKRCMSHAGDELKSFRSCLRWMCVDHTGDPLRAALSWSVFLLLAVAVPAVSHLLLVDAPRRDYDAVAQLSLTSAASLAYVSLSGFVRQYGLRRFLFLDKLVGESQRVRHGYTSQLNGSIRLLSIFVLPCFAAECLYKLWWYASGAAAAQVPAFAAAAPAVFAAAACVLELASWIYRTGIFFLVCVLFRISCHLQILRLHDFAMAFDEDGSTAAGGVAAVMVGHRRIRKQLRVTSHRYRFFIVAALCLVTVSQFAALLLATRPHAHPDLFNAGELALGSIGLVVGLGICLRCASKITHKAQAITAHAAAWHAMSTVESDEGDDPEAPPPPSDRAQHRPEEDSDDEDDVSGDDDDDEFVGTKSLSLHHANTISFQKRQALVTYLENNRAGITVFGFVVDRLTLHMIFMIEFSLVLWLLGKTIGIS